MTDEIKALAEDKLSEAHEILVELCQLKSYKDNVGKDSLYLKDQPIAWARANQFLNSMIGYKAALSGTEVKEVWEAVSVDKELPEAGERVVCYRGKERLTFNWAAKDFKDLKVTSWLKKTTVRVVLNHQNNSL